MGENDSLSTDMLVNIVDTKRPNQLITNMNLSSVVLIILYFLSINFILDTFGPLPAFMAKSILLILVLIMLLLHIPLLLNNEQRTDFGFLNNPFFLVGTLGIFFALFLFLFFNRTIFYLGAFSLFIVSLFLLSFIRKQSNFVLYSLSFTSLVLFLVYIVVMYVSQVWLLVQWFSTGIISFFMPDVVDIGSSVNGFWIVLPFIVCSFISSLVISKNWLRGCIWCLLSFVSFVFVWKLYFFAGFVFSLFLVDDLFVFLSGLFVVELVVFLVLFRRYLFAGFHVIHFDRFTLSTGLRQGVVLVVLVVLLVSFFGVLVPFGSAREEGISVGFYAEDMLGSWDHPEYGRYGREASGMYGLLPMYLDSFSYECSLIVEDRAEFVNRTYLGVENVTRFVNLSEVVDFVEASSLCEVDLGRFDVLVFMGHNRSLSVAEYGCVWDFVRGGGGLLVLGDHTDVGGVRDPLNALLSEVDISFRFDSALPIDDRWRWETGAVFVDEWLRESGFDVRDLQISVGASLDVGLDAFPLVVGRYGFSDEGDASNVDFAFLGDYAYENGERLGDVVLAAGAWYGDGCVVVFGDTSTFQNSALSRSIGVVDGVLQWVAGERGVGDGFLWDGVAVVLVGVFCGILLVFPDKIRGTVVGVWVLVALLLLFSISGFSGVGVEDFGPEHVVVDAGFVERFAVDPFLDDSLSGVFLNLQRNGLWPVVVSEGFDFSVCEASFVVFNAPTRMFTVDVVSDLVSYMSDGGVVVVASGYLEKEAVVPLLNRFGMDIDNVPLGPVPYVEEDPVSFEFEPRFVNSWPIRFSSETARSFYNFSWNEMVYHLMVFEPVGVGGLLVVSDSDFLLDANIESIYDYWPGNIIFLKHIIDEVSSVGGGL